jgi:hypothetical protein
VHGCWWLLFSAIVFCCRKILLLLFAVRCESQKIPSSDGRIWQDFKHEKHGRESYQPYAILYISSSWNITGFQRVRIPSVVCRNFQITLDCRLSFRLATTKCLCTSDKNESINNVDDSSVRNLYQNTSL